MTIIKPTKIEDHITVVESVREEALSLLGNAVRRPDIPPRYLIDEGFTVLEAAQQHWSALTGVGYTDAARAQLERFFKALISAQTLWNTERRGGRSEIVSDIIENAEKVREELLLAGDLALRHNSRGKERLSLLREGDGLADLALDLNDLAVLVTDYRTEFEAINVDADDESQKAGLARDALQEALSEEEVGKSLTGYKELRDRIYVLYNRELSEIRAFANFAFRRDRNGARRKLFLSDYARRRNRRYRNGSSQETQASSDTAAS